MNKPKLILVGGGGHCKSCIDVIEQAAKHEIVGIIDLPEKKGEKILGYEVIGNDDDYLEYKKLGCEFLITVGQIKSAHIRKDIFEKLKSIDASLATIISPLAYVSKHAKVEDGSIVMHNVFVNTGAKIGVNCILNTNSHIEHDTIIGNHCHVSTNAVVNGDCKIGNGTFIGSNATISSQIDIGDNVIIGAGSVVIKKTEHNSVVAGVPAKKIKQRVCQTKSSL